jgi:hypothetical protein
MLTDGCRLDDDLAGELEHAGWTKRWLTRFQVAAARHWLSASYVFGIFE